MKKLMLLCTMLAAAFFTLTSCSDDDQNHVNPSNVPQNIIDEFNRQFPDAQNVKWESKGGGYYTASFHSSQNPKGDNTAWFNPNGNWDMTHYEIPFSALPAQVLAGFQQTVYGQNGSGWHTDNEVDVLHRNGNETLYVIEVKKKEGKVETEIDLYFTEEGILVKEIADSETDNDYDDCLPQKPGDGIQNWLNSSKYKNAKIVDIENEDNGTEVELVFEGKKVEVFFSHSQQWVYTKTEYDRHMNQVPALITDAVKQTDYWKQGYNRIDDVDFYETQELGNYYCVELEGRFDNDVKVYVGENGQLLENQQPNPGQGGGTPVDNAIQQFINQKYPGARILEKEYDHGLLEVEILHENVKKTVKFNGRNEWVLTEWEVRQLPEAVTKAIAAQNYQLDDHEFDYVETPTESWYEVEVRQQAKELKLYITPEGKILREEIDD